MVFDIGIDATYVHSFCVYFLVCDNYKTVAGRFEVLYFRVSSLISSKNCNQTISSRWDWLFRRPTTIPQKSPVFWSMAHCRWQSQLSLLLEVLQDWVDVLKCFIDFCPNLKPTKSKTILSQMKILLVLQKIRPWPQSGRLCRIQIWAAQYEASPSWW